MVIGPTVVNPEDRTIRPYSNGDFEVSLEMGDYWFIIGRARVLVSVPDDSNSYQIDQRIVSAVVQSPTSPVGSAVPNGSPSVFGLLKTSDVDATPVVQLGMRCVTDGTALLALPNKASNHICWLCFPAQTANGWEPRAVRWNGASVATHDGLNCFKPTDTAGGSPGRWETYLQ